MPRNLRSRCAFVAGGTRRGPLGVFERFTQQGREAVALAHAEARELRFSHVGTESLLLGLLREEGVAAEVLESLDVTVERVRAQVVQIVGSGEDLVSGEIPFTPRATSVLGCAFRESLWRGELNVGSEHILLGLARVNEGVAMRTLRDIGVDSEKLRSAVNRMVPRPRPVPGVIVDDMPEDPPEPSANS